MKRLLIGIILVFGIITAYTQTQKKVNPKPTHVAILGGVASYVDSLGEYGPPSADSILEVFTIGFKTVTIHNLGVFIIGDFIQETRTLDADGDSVFARYYYAEDKIGDRECRVSFKTSPACPGLIFFTAFFDTSGGWYMYYVLAPIKDKTYKYEENAPKEGNKDTKKNVVPAKKKVKVT